MTLTALFSFSYFSIILSEMIHDNGLYSVELIWKKLDY